MQKKEINNAPNKFQRLFDRLLKKKNTLYVQQEGDRITIKKRKLTAKLKKEKQNYERIREGKREKTGSK